MPSSRSVINSALRKIGVLAAGREARPNDANDALGSMQSMYMGLINSGAFGRLRDVIPIADYTACENERVFRQNDGCTQVILPETIPVDPFCNVGYWNYETDPWGPLVTNATNYQVRPPRDCAVIVINDAFAKTTTTFVYDGAVKLWRTLDGIGLDDPAPLADRDPDGFASLLAMSMVDEFGGDMPASTTRSALAFQTSLTARFSAPRTEGCGVYC